MEVRYQLHTLEALPLRNEPAYPVDVCQVRSGRGEERNSCFCREWNTALRSVCSYFTELTRFKYPYSKTEFCVLVYQQLMHYLVSLHTHARTRTRTRTHTPHHTHTPHTHHTHHTTHTTPHTPHHTTHTTPHTPHHTPHHTHTTHTTPHTPHNTPHHTTHNTNTHTHMYSFQCSFTDYKANHYLVRSFI
jgi:hypothetical protein